jgi:hypothetical protein
MCNFETYRGSDGVAFVWVIITIVIWLLVLRGIKMMLRYVVVDIDLVLKTLFTFNVHLRFAILTIDRL